MTDEEMERDRLRWEQPGSLEAPEGIDDAARLDGIEPLPGLEIADALAGRSRTTSGGVELTDDLLEKLATEAEAGYDVSKLRERPKR